MDKPGDRRRKTIFTKHGECQKVVIDDQTYQWTIKEFLDSMFLICQVSYVIKSIGINHQTHYVDQISFKNYATSCQFQLLYWPSDCTYSFSLLCSSKFLLTAWPWKITMSSFHAWLLIHNLKSPYPTNYRDLVNTTNGLLHTLTIVSNKMFF